MRFSAGAVAGLVVGVAVGCTAPVEEPVAGARAALVGWAQRDVIAPDDSSRRQSFGITMAVDGDTLVVGTPSEVGTISEEGAAYVFTRTGETWTQQQKLVPSPRTTGERYGLDVAISGSTIAVLAQFPNSARVYTRTAGTWSESAVITPGAGEAFHLLALDGDTLAFAEQRDAGIGRVHVHARDGSGAWTRQATLMSDDATAGDRFGVELAISGSTIVVGAFAVDVGGVRDAGASYVFVRSGTTWTQQQRLTASAPVRDAWLGRAVAIDGDRVLAAALFEGVAYTFVRTGTAWAQEARLTTGAPEAGSSADLSGDAAIIGYPNHTPFGAFQAGGAWAWSRASGAWASEGALLAPDPERSDGLGWDVAIAGDQRLAGVPNDLRAMDVRGTVRVFRSGNANGAPCDPLLPCASGFCADDVCCSSACTGGAGDCRACSRAAGSIADGHCAPRTAGSVCRAAAGACDRAETCDGTAIACPADVLAPFPTVCRPSTGMCDDFEFCSPTSVDCPPDGPSLCFDAGPPDAGPPDAGPPDAGPPRADAGPPDAGAPDAGPIPVDAGPAGPDAGPAADDAGSAGGDAGLRTDAGSAAVDAGRARRGRDDGGCGCVVPGHAAPGSTTVPKLAAVLAIGAIAAWLNRARGRGRGGPRRSSPLPPRGPRSARRSS